MNTHFSNFIHRVYHIGTREYGRVLGIVGSRVPMNPLVLRIRITTRCNFHCEFCYQADSLNIKEHNHLTLDEWDHILRKLPPWTLIDITGGEPFLAKDFEKVLDLILSRGFKTSLITNASRCSESALELIVKKKLAHFMISVDGLEEYHNRIRGNSRAFRKMEETFKSIHQLKKNFKTRFPVTCVKTTLTENNYRELIPLNSFIVNELHVDTHSLNLMFQNPVRGGNEVYLDWNERFLSGNSAKYPEEAIKEIASQVRRLITEGEKSGKSVLLKPEIHKNKLESYLRNPSDFGVRKCHKDHSVVTMYYDGTLTPCDIGLNVGNVRDLRYDLRVLWRTERFKTFKNNLKKYGNYHPACDGCCLMPHSTRTGASK